MYEGKYETHYAFYHLGTGDPSWRNLLKLAKLVFSLHDLLFLAEVFWGLQHHSTFEAIMIDEIQSTQQTGIEGSASLLACWTILGDSYLNATPRSLRRELETELSIVLLSYAVSNGFAYPALWT